MNLTDKSTNINFAVVEPLLILRLSGDDIAAHRDLDKAVIFRSDGVHFFAIGRE
jgi:hypothetical protein